MTHPEETALSSARERHARLGAIDWPADAVVVADAALPAAILDALPDPLTVEAGEPLKSLGALEQLAERVLARRSTRPMTLVAVGGGSIGDAVGFLASILWRGVPLWHLPTTLLAMVDSAHGGKTAVNLGSFKNQLGTFYAADKVILVDEIVAELPVRQREEGLAELVKGLWLGDARGLDALDEVGSAALASLPFAIVGEPLMELLERAIEVKLDVVARDPRETKGIRTLLNFGHTVAHALELSSHLSHGHAVAWGMWAAAEASEEAGTCDAATATRLRQHLFPLLQPLSRTSLPDEAGFLSLVDRDKKKVDGKLRSIVVRAPGSCEVVDDIAPAAWWRALERGHARWSELSLVLEPGDDIITEPVSIEVPSSKSEVNRMLTIAALRRGQTRVHHTADADDVVYLARALEQLRAGSEEVDAGEGGTTLRFLLAYAATLPRTTHIRARERLLARPHGPLLEALQELGVQIEQREDGFAVHGPLPAGPLECAISVAESSQFASALALVAASGRSLRLSLEGEIVSEPYFEMTLALLEKSGVSVRRHASTVVLEPSEGLEEALELEATDDASSAVAWVAMKHLGVPVEVAIDPDSLQPDRAIETILDRVRGAKPRSVTEIDLSDSPDLAPVLAAAMAIDDRGIRIVGAGHLRHKESNRIDDLVDALAEVGIVITPTEDGLEVPSRPQLPRDGATFDPRGDHRLAMAALTLLSRGGRIRLADPWVVTKSYPRFWHDARRVGFRTTPELEVDRGE